MRSDVEPSLSVVLPTYNEPERLEVALRSLADQDYPTRSAEIIVVDDASPQLDPERVRAAAGRLELQLIRHETNQGRARARNSGIRAASGDVVVFLDSDMTVRPDFLQTHGTMQNTHAGTVIVGQIRFGPEIPNDALARYTASRGVSQLLPGEPVPYKCFVTGNSSVRRELLLRVGLFDEDFREYGGEDLELGYRLHLDGAAFHYAPEALSYHHHLRSLDEVCHLMFRYGATGLPVLLRKHPALAPLLRLDFLGAARLSPRRLLLRLALAPAAHAAVRRLVRLGLRHYVPGICFDYLWWYNRTRGYLTAAPP